MDEASICVVGNWVDGWVRCVHMVLILVLGGGTYPMLCKENNVGLLEGFFNYFREVLL